MPLVGTPISATPVDTTPPTIEPADMVSDYRNLMADQDFRMAWREGSNSAEYMKPGDVRDLYELEKQKALDAERATAGGLFKRIVD